MSSIGRVCVLAAFAALAAMPRAAEAKPKGYGPWYYLGSGVSVAFKDVGPGQTWMFRNDGPGKITSLEFEYTDREGKHKDCFPGSLRQGSAFGGWAAFLSSGRVTRMRILSIQRGR